MRYQGKIAMVTGSNSGGLGQRIVEDLAREGAKGLVITGLPSANHEKAIQYVRSFGVDVLYVEADLQNPDDCKRLIAEADQYFGHIDGLVNCAAITHRGTIEDTDIELWDRHMAINLRAPFILMQGCIRIMRREGIEGSIVNILSTSGYGGEPYLTPYTASKGGLLSLTRNVANTQRYYNIRVNAISPGWMNTPAEDRIQKKYHGAKDDWVMRAEESLPMKKMVPPEDVAKMVTMLLSDDTRLMTGSIIDYDQRVIGAFD